MKRLSYLVVFLVFTAMMTCFGVKALAGDPYDCYLRTGDRVYFGKDIREGDIHTRITLDDGTFAEFDNHDVAAFKHHGKLYMRLPVICNKQDTLCFAMMEYITSKAGCTVFRYCCPISTDESFKLACVNRNFFFVYKEGKFNCRLSDDQTEALKTYGINVI